MGRVFEKIDTSKFQKMSEEVDKYFEEEENFNDSIVNSSAFNLVWMAKKYDDWFLDPIVGLIIPGVGDIISSLAALPALYVAMFKVKSFKLTLAIFYITVLDILCGIIPGVGDVVDAFYKANKKSARWIVGYVEGNQNTISEVNKSAAWGSVMLIIIGVLLWLLFSAIVEIFHWVTNLFA